MLRNWKLGPLYMDPDIFDYAVECPVCLRWFVPIYAVNPTAPCARASARSLDTPIEFDPQHSEKGSLCGSYSDEPV